MDKNWTEFSTLDDGVLVYAMQLHSEQKQLNLKLKTQLKQLLEPLSLALCTSQSVDLFYRGIELNCKYPSRLNNKTAQY
jgi:hypothetical protein